MLILRHVDHANRLLSAGGRWQKPWTREKKKTHNGSQGDDELKVFAREKHNSLRLMLTRLAE